MTEVLGAISYWLCRILRFANITSEAEWWLMRAPAKIPQTLLPAGQAWLAGSDLAS